MKKLIFPLLICITFFSCKKDPNTPSGTNATGSIEYKVNGSLTVFDNVDILTGQYAIFYKQLKGVITDTRYLLNAQKGANNVLTFNITTDSLKQMNYHYDNTFPFAGTFLSDYNGQFATMFSSGDYFDINITDYKSGRVSGTFAAKFTPYTGTVFGPPGSFMITEGKINNVQVVY